MFWFQLESLNCDANSGKLVWIFITGKHKIYNEQCDAISRGS